MHQQQAEPWKVLSSSYPLKTPWLNIRQDECQLPDGSVIDDYYVMEQGDVSGVFAITEDRQVVLNLQYKHGIREVVREIPAGMIDAGETPEQAARRELEEETGYEATNLLLVSTLIASPTTVTNRFFVYLATDVKLTGEKDSHPREVITNELVSVDEIWKYVEEGKISVLWSVAAIALCLEKYKSYDRK